MEYSAMEQYWIWLASVEGLGPKRFYQLLSQYEDARTVWDNVGPEMRFLGERVYEKLVAARDERYFYRLFSRLEQLDVTVLTRMANEYPPLLADIYDPPPVLYVRGNRALRHERPFAVVGSRRATRDGRRAAEEISCELGRQGVCVVSGLARGVDTCAHKGCLDGGGRTIAVLGCGVDVVYPPENAALLRRLLENGGSVISEYPPGTPPLGQHFPARNRIISGLSRGVLLVEGAQGSGAMITVDFAADQGRDVFALPGSIYSPLSGAPNRLLVEGAVPVLSAWEILEYYRWGERPQNQPEKGAPVALDEEEEKLVQFIRNEELSFDELAVQTGFNSAKLNSLLTRLELRGIIKQAPGRLYRAY